MTTDLVTPSTGAAGAAPKAALLAPAAGFFERRMPAWIILASFLFVTLPVVAALIYTNSHKLLFFYIWIFSATHFVVTFTLYLQSENLRHFTATRRNLVLFVLIPLGIFAVFYLTRVLRVAPQFPTLAIFFAAAVRILDFNHFNRQSFGVYQLFKARTGRRVAPLAKKLENLYFISLSAMLFITYLSGGLSPWIARGRFHSIGGMSFAQPLAPLPYLSAAAAVCAAIAAILLATSLLLVIRAGRSSLPTDGLRPGLWEGVVYLFFQTLSAGLAIAFLPLYTTALAIHYAEYHVLMYPRCFRSRLDLTQAVDRWYQALRGSRALFYAVLIMISGVVTLTTTMSGAWGRVDGVHNIPYIAIIAIFDGIFVCHYFVEMLIWRFSDPFFRKSAVSLYFAPRARA
jgi:hypothetical protein